MASLVVASHRGPLEYSRRDGTRVASRGSGGLVTAFAGLGAIVNRALWICAAISDEDVAVSREHAGEAFTAEDAHGWMLRMLEIEPERHRRFYTMIANPLLWFIQHRLWDISDAPDIGAAEHEAWADGYVAVNRAFADAIVAHVAGEDEPAILVQDYHLYLVPGMVREAVGPDAFISLFCHIPWPEDEAWRVLPEAWRRAVFEGLLGADIVGFHTEVSARNFVAGCARVLGAEVDERRLVVRHGDRETTSRWYPISVDTDQFDALATSPKVLEHEAALIAARRDKLIVRIDRTDPSKNVLRGFRAFARLLDLHPELRGAVTFLALLQPSRQDVIEYADYLDRILRTVADLNLAYGDRDWKPVDLRLVDDVDLAVAAYRQFDVLFVNAIADGMNLVAKEGVLVNTRAGVLVLSETTGASAELGEFAVTVHPFDVEQQAEALWHALSMPLEERQARLDACAQTVRRNDLRRWLREQLDDRPQPAPIRTARRARRRSAG